MRLFMCVCACVCTGRVVVFHMLSKKGPEIVWSDGEVLLFQYLHQL